ncbi:PREDICTED: CD160 antigen isoform X2 [Myotis brandtii]|uniref:CD160 antigen isoform X2 n=1 Tax=Myotis brandtii TaxID=109478 RepID=UPI000703DDB3|nr:PREDICTED: CD160 antigen isoform X2 [Myotis brandtii]
MFIFFDPEIQFNLKKSENTAFRVSLLHHPSTSLRVAPTEARASTREWLWSCRGLVRAPSVLPGERGQGHQQSHLLRVPELLTTCRTPMASGRGCWALATLLAIVDIELGGCMRLLSSASQEGKRLSLICTLRHTNEEAEGAIVFLCKDRPSDCSPETSLKHLRLRRSPEMDGASERSSQLEVTLTEATPLASGTYQCCAKSQAPEILLQGHFLSVSVTETGNYTVTGGKLTGQQESSHGNGPLHSKGPLSPSALQEVLVMLATSLMVLQAL